MLEEEKAGITAASIAQTNAAMQAPLDEQLRLSDERNAATNAAIQEMLARIPEQAEQEEQGRLRNLLGKVGSGAVRSAKAVGHTLTDVAAVTSMASPLAFSSRVRDRAGEAFSHFGGDEDED